MLLYSTNITRQPQHLGFSKTTWPPLPSQLSNGIFPPSSRRRGLAPSTPELDISQGSSHPMGTIQSSGASMLKVTFRIILTLVDTRSYVIHHHVLLIPPDCHFRRDMVDSSQTPSWKRSSAIIHHMVLWKNLRRKTQERESDHWVPLPSHVLLYVQTQLISSTADIACQVERAYKMYASGDFLFLVNGSMLNSGAQPLPSLWTTLPTTSTRSNGTPSLMHFCPSLCELQRKRPSKMVFWKNLMSMFHSLSLTLPPLVTIDCHSNFVRNRIPEYFHLSIFVFLPCHLLKSTNGFYSSLA